MADNITGTVKWFNAKKGYGFIVPDGGGDEVFLHLSTAQRCGVDSVLRNDSRVSFALCQGRRGAFASSVSLI